MDNIAESKLLGNLAEAKLIDRKAYAERLYALQFQRKNTWGSSIDLMNVLPTTLKIGEEFLTFVRAFEECIQIEFWNEEDSDDVNILKAHNLMGDLEKRTTATENKVARLEASLLAEKGYLELFLDMKPGVTSFRELLSAYSVKAKVIGRAKSVMEAAQRRQDMKNHNKSIDQSKKLKEKARAGLEAACKKARDAGVWSKRRDPVEYAETSEEEDDEEDDEDDVDGDEDYRPPAKTRSSSLETAKTKPGKKEPKLIEEDNDIEELTSKLNSLPKPKKAPKPAAPVLSAESAPKAA
jgi:hypothetical protein